MASEVRQGNCLEVARGLDAESVDLVYADPAVLYAEGAFARDAHGSKPFPQHVGTHHRPRIFHIHIQPLACVLRL